jgi:hypothetical protein
VREKLFACPSAKDYLKAIGFVEAEEDGVSVLRVDGDIDIVVMQASLQEVSNGLDIVAPTDGRAPAFKKHRSTSFEEEKKDEDVLSMSRPAVSKMSEKQKARLLMEEKEKREREEAKSYRKRTSALIKTDKYVRQKDENWTSQPSAACVKTGDSISTFRDRHGEN